MDRDGSMCAADLDLQGVVSVLIPSSDKADERRTLISRSRLDVGRYRERAKGLGYDGKALERHGVRWSALLEKAGHGNASYPLVQNLDPKDATLSAAQD